MVKSVRNAIIYFLCSLLVIQLLFPGEARESSASHSWDARLGLKIVQKTVYARDNSRPSPFNGKTGRNHACLGIKEAGRRSYEVSYCIDYGLGAWTNDYMTSNYTNVTDSQRVLLNYTMLYGFNSNEIDLKNMTNKQVNEFFATQSLVWIIKEGYFYKESERSKIESFLLGKLYPDSKNYYKELYAKVKYMAMAPSYATDVKSSGNAHTMIWNASKNKYEVTLANTFKNGGNSANSTLTVDKTSLPSGVSVNVSGEKITITSTKALSGIASIRFVKNIGKKGQLVAWKNSASNRQSMITLDYGEKPYEKECYVNVKTESLSGLKIVKKANDDVIKGISYKVTSTAYSGTKTYTTGNDGIVNVSSINPGTYTITEVQNNLNDYLKVGAQKVTIKSGETKTVTFNNIRKRIRVDITKMFEGDSGNALVDGSVYGVYKDGNKLEEVTISGGKGVTKYYFYYSNSTYTVKELKSGKGGEVDNTIHNIDTSTVSSSTTEYNTVYVKYTGKAIKNNITIVKTLEKNYMDTADSIAGKNIEFKATLKSSGKTYVAKTDNNGKAIFKNLPYGIYKVEEVAAPEGYIKIEPFEVNISSSEAGVYTYSKVNNIIKGNVEIVKKLELNEYEKATGKGTKYAKGVKFVANPIVNGQVNKEVAIYSEVTDENGKTIINNLTYGQWQISELAETVPIGYKTIEPVKVEIKENGKVVKLDLEDKLIRGTINIIKTLEKTDMDMGDSEKYGKGVKFIAKPIIDGVVKEEGAINSEATDEKGKVSFKDIGYGDWQISEVKESLPEGYLAMEPMTVAITKEQTKVDLNIMNNAKKGKVFISKIDEKNKLPISGAEIEIYNANGKKVFSGTSDEVGDITTTLYFGKYTYKEVKAPEGYVPDDATYEFEITGNNQIVEEEFINKRITGTLSIIKVSANDKEKRLPNTEFTLYKKDGTKVGVYTTDKNGELSMGPLEYGEYYYVETKAPEGYKLDSTEYAFSITKEGEVITKVVTNEIIALTPKQENPDAIGDIVEVQDDETPLTAESSNVEMAMKLMGAAGISMALVGMTEVIKRRRYKY